MGFFSWVTQDTGKSIANKHSCKPTFRVRMVDDKGVNYVEDDYEGYGEFGGKDFFVLVAEMNGAKGQDHTKEELRDIGLKHVFGKEVYLSPNLYEFQVEWQDKIPEDCEYQGFFYDETMDEIFDV